MPEAPTATVADEQELRERVRGCSTTRWLADGRVARIEGGLSNRAWRLDANGERWFVAGVNLPMLLRAVCYRAGPLAELVSKAITGGEQGIVQSESAGGAPVQNQARKRAGDDQQRIQDQQ